MVQERAIRAEQQRKRRTARRVCGLCGEQADVMLQWGAQSVPICNSCNILLKSLLHREPACALYEVPPGQLRRVEEVLSPPATDVHDKDIESSKSEGRNFWKLLWG